MYPSKQNAIDEYNRGIRWLKTHIARDDIYDFAHQLLSASEYILCEVNENMDLCALIDEDPYFEHCLGNILSIQTLKNDGFDGIIDTSWDVLEK